MKTRAVYSVWVQLTVIIYHSDHGHERLDEGDGRVGVGQIQQELLAWLQLQDVVVNNGEAGADRRGGG